jgi:hypothetical protein
MLGDYFTITHQVTLPPVHVLHASLLKRWQGDQMSCEKIAQNVHSLTHAVFKINTKLSQQGNVAQNFGLFL